MSLTASITLSVTPIPITPPPHLSLPHLPPPHHLLQAIEELGAERIGHGYHVLDDEEVYQLAKEKKVHFEVSNLVM